MRRILFILILLLSSALFAEDKGLIEVKAQVDTAVITIGDRIHYSIIIDRKKELRVERPGEGLNLGMFEIKAYDFPEPVEKDGRMIERFNFTISVYDTGHYVIPPFPVAYFPKDTTNKYQIIEAPAISILVKSVLEGSEARELKDVKAPVDIPFNYRFWISMLVIVVLLILAGWLIYRLIKKRRETGYIFNPPPPPPPAHVTALNDLQELFASDLLEKGDYKQFFSRLSEIIRIYLEGRYYVLAMEQTTAEIMRAVQNVLSEETLQNELHQLLTMSDLVKFAKHKPEPEDVEHVKEAALNFVETTKLVYEPQREIHEGSEQNDSPESEPKLIEAGSSPEEDTTVDSTES